MNNIVTVLSELIELIESIDVHKLIELAENMDKRFQLQRLGYMVEKIDVMNDDIKKAIIELLTEYVSSNVKSYTHWHLTYPG